MNVVSQAERRDESENEDHSDGKNAKGNRQTDPEEPTTKCKQFKRMIASKWRWSWVFNAVVVILLSVLIIIFEYDIVKFKMLGYECHDPKLSHKYKGDTIRYGYLVIMVVFLPILIIFIIEFLVHSKNLSYRNTWKKKTFTQTTRYYAKYFLGLLFVMVFFQFVKNIVGEPRPHFFETCKPDKMNCTGYVLKYKCTNKDYPKSVVRDSSKSFPSGHSSMGWYGTVFMIWYFQIRVPPSDYLVIPFLQSIFLAWGFLSSFTRITDHRHHWWDVLAGSLIGILFGIFTVKIFCKGFQTGEKSMNVILKKPRKQEKPVKETRSSNSWYKKIERNRAETKSNVSQPPPEDKELREVK